ncbi:hydroxyethylthiazole kinase [uncultured Aeromicrobium sp.]|uniref:hydroxyethylthiazole kinase n=1 Tax=uncultured Aeromicrobium sp. TaxID=337820 RepID=UPI0025FF04B2|nr:hydroxyethylthiazole kinase [uncultured Aeromicrobium sp.]
MSAEIAVDAVIDTVHRLHQQAPLVQCITNYVSMDLAANVLNAARASPAMVHDEREAAEMARLASAVVVNIGTLSPPWVIGMQEAARMATQRGIPWVLDPVAVGATAYRRKTADALLAHRPTVIRANASEVVALATTQGAGRGVDSTHEATAVIEQAQALASVTGSTVVVSGAADVVTDGATTAIITGGDDRMPLISALGCAATALVAAATAVAQTPLLGAATAMAMLAEAGERAGRSSQGPGTLRSALLDALWSQRPEDVADVVLR